jgi:hypothetical protein
MDVTVMLQTAADWVRQSADQVSLWLAALFAGAGDSALADNPVTRWIADVLAGWRAQPNVAISSALAALAAVLALASISQTRLVRKRLDSVKGDFFAAFRPKLVVRDVYAPHFNTGEPVEVRYAICNTGSSPATLVESSIAVEVLRPTGLALVPQCNGGNPVGEVLINPGEVRHLGFRSPDVNWERNFVRAGSANAPKLVFAGQLGYRDARGITRRTSFCRSFDVKRERFYPIGDPELEYAD